MTHPAPLLTCLLADPSAAEHYRPERLDAADRRRAAATPAITKRIDWQSSRYLKQQADASVVSLSHSRGYAAVLTAHTALRAGVDIEAVRPRDFAALAAWVCSPQEQAFLQQSPQRDTDFYRLWCIKEALLKASGGQFPADMAQAGYLFNAHAHPCGLHTKGQIWQGISARLGETHMVACVWQGHAPPPEWRFYGALTPASLRDITYWPPCEAVSPNCR
ncbi:4'-phosphopantetheinyl transferase family protein [Bergeriella denitrificans]|uniref:Holo-(Acyl carrier protein) synthase 2 n=1 Tax=Bergeriella denitrificans TaxID=494 RepID=A0A378UGW6_BERDE|nr:4'-phosphopantetheinyl transferase superfamily protein [Bergeriella denitrificans]STZ76545.1 holo-(acyl carrier protein) synthase 2 [Bergeriella denitrificans]